MTGSGRGRWDRARSRLDRRNQTRAAILEAARAASAQHGALATVTHVVRHAGIGRNTFYVHFPDLGAALAAAEDETAADAARAFESAMKGARTPIEKLRAVSRAWLDTRAGVPHAESAGSLRYLDRETGRLERTLRDVLTEARAAGVVGRGPDARRVRCLAGAFVAAAIDGAPKSPADADDLAEILADFTLRVFR